MADLSVKNTQYDVVIVGAGAAGLAAAEKCKENGLSFVIVEAASEIGGRIQSHVLPSGSKVDNGAHWLHLRENDPLLPLVQKHKLAYELDAAETNHTSFINGKSGDGVATWKKAMDVMFEGNHLTMAEALKEHSDLQ